MYPPTLGRSASLCDLVPDQLAETEDLTALPTVRAADTDGATVAGRPPTPQ